MDEHLSCVCTSNVTLLNLWWNTYCEGLIPEVENCPKLQTSYAGAVKSSRRHPDSADCGQRDRRWTIVSWSFIIWRFARVAALLPRLALHRMAPTNVIPRNSSGTGNVCVVSAVSFSPRMCILVAHEAARWWFNSVCLFGRLRQLVISGELRWRCAKRSDKGECESSASGGTFHQLNWLGDRRSLLLGSGMFSHAGAMLHKQSFHWAATVSHEDTTSQFLQNKMHFSFKVRCCKKKKKQQLTSKQTKILFSTGILHCAFWLKNNYMSALQIQHLKTYSHIFW